VRGHGKSSGAFGFAMIFFGSFLHQGKKERKAQAKG
jgi:hypothetical protein